MFRPYLRDLHKRRQLQKLSPPHLPRPTEETRGFCPKDIYNVLQVKCFSCEMFYKWNVSHVKCFTSELFYKWNVLQAKCFTCKTFNKQSALQVKCFFFFTCEIRDLSRVSENLLTPPKIPDMNTIGTEALEIVFKSIHFCQQHHHGIHIVLTWDCHIRMISWKNLKAKATRPMMVEVSPSRQRG